MGTKKRELVGHTVHGGDPPELLNTPRLILRKPRLGDASLIFAEYAQDPAVTRYLLWRPHTDIAETRNVIESFLANWDAGTSFCWLIFDHATNTLAGSIAARTKEDGFDVGYLLARRWWGKGLMAEAITAVTDWAFKQPWVRRVCAACDVENRGSARALEKAGFVRETVLPRYSVHPNISPEPRNCYLYAKVRSEPT